MKPVKKPAKKLLSRSRRSRETRAAASQGVAAESREEAAKKVVRRERTVPAPTSMTAAVAAPPEPGGRRRRRADGRRGVGTAHVGLSRAVPPRQQWDPRNITRVKVTANDQPVHDHAFMPPLPPQQFYRAVPDPVLPMLVDTVQVEVWFGPTQSLSNTLAPPRAVAASEVSADVTGPGSLGLVGEWPAPQGGNLVFA